MQSIRIHITGKNYHFMSGLRIQMNLIRIRILRFGLIRIRIMFESDFNLYLLPIFLYKLYVTYNYKIVIAQIILINKIHFIHPQKYLFPIIYTILILYIVKQIPWKVWIWSGIILYNFCLTWKRELFFNIVNQSLK